MLLKGERKIMADYKGGEIFIDLGGIDIATVSSSNTNTVVVSGIYSRLETAFNLGKRIVITNYKSKQGDNPIKNCVPASVALYRPTGATFYIPILANSGISIIQILSSNAIKVLALYAYHNIYTPPETTSNSAKNIDETIEEIEETEKGEESK